MWKLLGSNKEQVAGRLSLAAADARWHRIGGKHIHLVRGRAAASGPAAVPLLAGARCMRLLLAATQPGALHTTSEDSSLV